MERALKIPGTFQGTFSSDSVVQVIILVHSKKKKKEERQSMANVNLGQTWVKSCVRKLHFSTSLECTSKPGYEGTFCM